MDANSKITAFIENIRKYFLNFSRKVFNLLPETNDIKILDLGCGSGSLTLELVNMTRNNNGAVIGIDINQTQLEILNKKIKSLAYEKYLSTKLTSLYEYNVSGNPFDIIWTEGVIHLLDLKKALKKCNELLKPGGILIQHDTLEWMKKHSSFYQIYGFKQINCFLLPENAWWTEYYRPLEEFINKLKIETEDPNSLKIDQRYLDEIIMVKKNPRKFDTGFYLMKKL
jgi:ubiquinone/menaquinone biosynthesis C-methylase UbiE